MDDEEVKIMIVEGSKIVEKGAGGKNPPANYPPPQVEAPKQEPKK